MADKHLIIVESPAKARTLQKFVSKDYSIKASLGHVRDLPKTRIGVDVEHQFTPRYVNIQGKQAVIKEIKDAARTSDHIYLAPDPDREGEAIAWHISSVLNLSDVLRIQLHEITREALYRALENPAKIDMDKVYAQQARRILDRLVGYKLSPLLWRKVTGGLSAGRVQSVAVRLIVERQREIDAFVKSEYWTIAAELMKEGQNIPFKADLIKYRNEKIEIPNEEHALQIKEELEKSLFTVAKPPQKKVQKREPSPPFITSTLQQEASRRLNFNVGKTMRVAQQLYEGLDIGEEGRQGLITYMRTDSTRIAEAARAEAEEFIESRYGAEYKGPRRTYKKVAGAQEAHECIRPTSMFRDFPNLRKLLTPDQFRLYRLIHDRFIASQMAACELDVVTVEIASDGYLLKAQGSSVRFPGFTKVYSEDKDENQEKDDETAIIPELMLGEKLVLGKILPVQHFTQPPPLYTEATLVKTLEKNGIGRPSTYAPIVETIQKRGYVELKEKRFNPTILGVAVTDLLVKHFNNIVDYNFTAQIEQELDKIEEGKVNWVQVLQDFYGPFSETLSFVEDKIEKVTNVYEVTEEKCDNCGKPMVIKTGRYGKFLACSGFPECKTTKPYYEKIGVACPKCNGSIIAKKSKKGVFYGCTGYPGCDFTSWNKPIDKKCTACGSIMVLKFGRNRKAYPQCINPDCTKKDKKKAKEAVPVEAS